MNDTTIIFNVNAGMLIVSMAVFFISLFAIIWKGKKEISDAIKEEIMPFKKTGTNIVNAITEVQTILRNKFKGLNIAHSLVEKSGSPLRPTEYGVQLIKESGLEKILDDNKDFLCTKLKASLPKEYTEYDVQEKARSLLIELKDDPILNPVKKWIYENPTDIEVLLKVAGLWLRDDFLKQPRSINKDQENNKKN